MCVNLSKFVPQEKSEPEGSGMGGEGVHFPIFTGVWTVPLFRAGSSQPCLCRPGKLALIGGPGGHRPPISFGEHSAGDATGRQAASESEPWSA